MAGWGWGWLTVAITLLFEVSNGGQKKADQFLPEAVALQVYRRSILRVGPEGETININL